MTVTPTTHTPTPTMLASLPTDHPLRNTPLVSIRAQSRWKQSTRESDWKSIRPSWGIAKCTYNQLGPSWTDSDDFRVQPDQTEPANPA